MTLTRVNNKGSASLRALLGEEIVFKVHGEPQARKRALLTAEGKNIQVPTAGTTDWFWVPKIDGMWMPSPTPIECRSPTRHRD